MNGPPGGLSYGSCLWFIKMKLCSALFVFLLVAYLSRPAFGDNLGRLSASTASLHAVTSFPARSFKQKTSSLYVTFVEDKPQMSLSGSYTSTR